MHIIIYKHNMILMIRFMLIKIEKVKKNHNIIDYIILDLLLDIIFIAYLCNTKK